MKVLVAAMVAALAAIVPTPDARQPAQDPPAIREVSAAFAAAYNLNHDEALAHARRAVTIDPNSSRAQRGLASIIWVELLFQRGAMTVDHYLGDLSTSQLQLAKPNAAMAAEFKDAMTRAIDLAEQRLRQRPNDVDAMFDVGAAYGVQASYTASIEGGITAAFKFARRAFDMQEAVLEHDPTRAQAGLIVGTYRYLVSTQPMYVRVVAYLAGFAGGKEKAFALLEAASHDPLSRVDAKAALILIYSREGRHSEAMRLAHELSIELPGNRLFVLEEGAAAIRAGRPGDAETVLTTGLAAFEQDTRPKIPGEHALWLYKRGLARLNLNHPADATADLRRALTVNPLAWVQGRIRVALGKLADLAGRRTEAVAEYTKAKVLCDAGTDTMCADEARLFLKQPFSFERR
jgi:tetratricopeptide (TPR) repeat protein